MPQEKFEEPKSLNGTNEGATTGLGGVLNEAWGPRDMSNNAKNGGPLQERHSSMYATEQQQHQVIEPQHHIAGPPLDSMQEPTAQRPQEFPQTPDSKAATQGSPESQGSPSQQQKPTTDSPANQGPADATKDDAKPADTVIDFSQLPIFPLS